MDLHLPNNSVSTTITSKATGKSHTAFEAILFLVVIGLFYWFIISPKQDSIKAIEVQYDHLKQQEALIQKSKKDLNQALSDLKNHPQEISQMDEALPLDNRVSKLYIALSSLTEGSGMTVGNINISYGGAAPMAGDKSVLTDPYGQKRSVQKLTTTLTISGTFDQFQALLEKLQNSGRIINMNSLNVASNQGGIYDFSVNLEAYYFVVH